MAGEVPIVQQKIVEDSKGEQENSPERSCSDDEKNEGEDLQESCTKIDNNSELHFAAAFGSIDNIKQELALSNKKVDVENFMGWTPLMMAIRNGHMEAVKLLLENGADITRKNKLGVNCFNLSIANGDLELVETVLRHMLSGGISRNRIQENLSPISLAIILRQNHLLRFLMSQGFDLNSTTWKTGLTPLMFAAAVNADKAMSMLETKGAEVNAKNYMGVDYHDILKWREQGLERLKQEASNIKKQQFKLPNIIIDPEHQMNAVPTFPFIQMPNPSYNTEKAKVFVPQEVIAVPDGVQMNDENDINLMNKPADPAQSPKITHPIITAPMKDTKHPTVGNENSFINQSSQFESPYNGLPCPMYIPFNVVGSPYLHSPVTPLMVPPSYQNFMAAVAEQSQNTPSPLNHYQPGAQVFFASPFDPNIPNANALPYPTTPMFYPVYPNMRGHFNPPVPEK